MKNTKHIQVDNKPLSLNQLNQISTLINAGGTVVFPTETVYGIGANALDSVAVGKIFTAKGRPDDNPLIVHIADIDQLYPLVQIVSPLAKRLIDAFWPGPLTLIFNKRDTIPDSVTAGLSTVAIRMPADVIAREIIRAAGVPLAAPSANLSGKPSPTRVKHVCDDMMGRVDLIVAAGDVTYGLESTVLDITREPAILLRPGAITLEQLLDLGLSVKTDSGMLEQTSLSVPRSPGMKYKHYAPNADVYVVSDQHNAQQIQQIIDSFTSNGKRLRYIDLSASELAVKLFTILRTADDDAIDVVLVKAVSENGIGLAVMNRLLKAADFRVL